MTCRELVGLLLEFVCEELTAECHAECCEHVCCCPRCANVVETYRITIRLTRCLPRRQLPGHLEARLREAIARAMSESA